MRKLKSCLVAACLLTLSGCSTASSISTPPATYVGIPAGLMARCIVHDVALDTVADLVISRNKWKEGHERCAAQVDAIRKHDAEMRDAVKTED